MNMKKIFTLLFCVIALGFTVNADEMPMVDKCIDVLLGAEQPTQLMAVNLDANHDGVISIADLTTLIDQAMVGRQTNHANAPKQAVDVEALIDEVLTTQTGEPSIKEVTNAIEQSQKDKK